MARLPPVLCLQGPTAIGKTALALALVARYPLEIVSVDSAMVYRGLDVGTGKPDAETLRRVRHRLVDIRDPSEAYSAGDFARDAWREIDDIRHRGRIPLLVGGTGLYFRSLIDGIAALPPACPELRRRIDDEARAQGWPALHADLRAVDPTSARRIHPRDGQRIQRALEVWRLSGRPLSAWLTSPPRPAQRARFARIVLLPETRGALHDVIARRFAGMLEGGLVEEVAALRRRDDLRPGLPALRAVGYRQVWAYLDGIVSRHEMTEGAVAATRQLARRQLTWLRRELHADPRSARGEDRPSRHVEHVEPGRADPRGVLERYIEAILD